MNIHLACKGSVMGVRLIAKELRDAEVTAETPQAVLALITNEPTLILL